MFSDDFSIWYDLSTGRTTLGWYQSYLTQKYKFAYHECGQSFGHLCLMITVCMIFCRTNENCCSWKTLSGNIWSVNVALNLLKSSLLAKCSMFLNRIHALSCPLLADLANILIRYTAHPIKLTYQTEYMYQVNLNILQWTFVLMTLFKFNIFIYHASNLIFRSPESLRWPIAMGWHLLLSVVHRALTSSQELLGQS